MLLQVAISNRFELPKRLASVFFVVDVCDFPTIDPQMTFAPGSDIDLKLVVSHSCKELLYGGAFPHGNVFVRFPIWLVRGHLTNSQLQEALSDSAISGTCSGIASAAAVAATTWATDTPGA